VALGWHAGNESAGERSVVEIAIEESARSDAEQSRWGMGETCGGLLPIRRVRFAKGSLVVGGILELLLVLGDEPHGVAGPQLQGPMEGVCGAGLLAIPDCV